MTETFYDPDTMTYKVRARYRYGWSDPRKVFGATLHKGEMVIPEYHGKESVDKGWSCPYCRSLYVDQRTSCPNCGAPR